MNLKDFKVVFAGCARDCSNFLPKTLDNIRYYSSLFGESYTVIVENGSVDTTKDILNKNQKKNDKFLFCDHFNNFPYRGQRLEKGRNLILETIKQDKKLRNCDLLIIIDLDDVGTNSILRALKYLVADGLGQLGLRGPLGNATEVKARAQVVRHETEDVDRPAVVFYC